MLNFIIMAAILVAVALLIGLPPMPPPGAGNWPSQWEKY